MLKLLAIQNCNQYNYCAIISGQGNWEMTKQPLSTNLYFKKNEGMFSLAFNNVFWYRLQWISDYDLYIHFITVFWRNQVVHLIIKIILDRYLLIKIRKECVYYDWGMIAYYISIFL